MSGFLFFKGFNDLLDITLNIQTCSFSIDNILDIPT